jgi:VWFA-related protein
MPTTKRLLMVAAVLSFAVAGTTELGSRTQTVKQDRQSLTSGTTAILVDVVVRDRRGKPVTDLNAEDFEIAEDGASQTIDSFTRVSRGGGIGVGVAWRSPSTVTAITTASHAAPATEPEPSDVEATTALVFDHLSSESLRLAQRATLDYVPMSGESNGRIGVFATDPGIRVMQRYTTDRTLVRQAVARIVPSGTSAEEEKQQRTDELVARRRELDEQARTAVTATSRISGAALAGAAAQIAERETERRLLQTELNIIRSFDSLDRDHRGYDTSMALLAVVESLAQLPGRKTLVFFSEGLPVSPSLSARLDSLIEAANRAHVTAYAVDAYGLRTKSASANIQKEMQSYVDERFGQLASATDRTDQPLAMGFERVEDTLRLDSRTGLARLAQDTGGFLLEQSNDLSGALRRIDEDSRFHYLLTYSPRNTNFDGRFRKISVKVRRPSTQVFARRGYRALHAAGPAIDVGYDVPALALLDGTRLPNAFPMHAAAFNFPDPARPGLTATIVQLGTDVLQFAVDPRRSTYSGQATIVVRIRDTAGREVEKLSQQYLLTGHEKDLDAAKRGSILYYRELDLSPGVYTMESIVYDAGARQGSARVATLTVPTAEPLAIGVSSLILVNRIEEVSETPDTQPSATGPLYVGRTLLYPNLGEAIRKSVTSALPFSFTVYGNVQDVKAYAELLRNGQAVAEAPVPLSPATGSRIQHVGRLPIDTLPAGTYELRIRVTAGRLEVSRAAFFTLQD